MTRIADSRFALSRRTERRSLSERKYAHMMYSADVPPDAPHLNDTWSFDGVEHGRPAFRSDQHGMWLRYDGGLWCISQDFVPLAYAKSTALHPNTIYPGEWCVLVSLPGGWRADPRFRVSCPPSDTSEQRPLRLDEVGVDLFVRTRPVPLWYSDPETGKVFHSSVRPGGKRFCSHCKTSLSSKNFMEHLRRAHNVGSHGLGLHNL